MLQIAFICCLLFISGCEKDSGRSGPPTASQTSKATARLSDRVKFLQQYVTFRREYVDLEYNVVFQNNGGGRGTLGPSDWDMRIVATVPPEQIQAWVPADAVEATAPKTEWLETTAQKIDVSSINEWHIVEGASVGVDRENSIVAFRSNTFGY